MEETVSKIQELPAFYLSLTSKELFHSNFLYWLSKKNLNAWGKLFECDNIFEVEREAKGIALQHNNKKYKPQADLIGRDREAVRLVVENKVKDIPHYTQLENLSQSFGSSPKYVLLSFVSPHFELSGEWEYVPFIEMAQRIEDNLEDFSGGSLYHEELIKDYIQLVNMLDTIYKSFPITGNYDFTRKQNLPLYLNLEKVKLWQVYQRIVGTSFENGIGEILRSQFPSLKTQFSITTQKACNDFYFEVNHFNIGVQIEDNQFRKYLYGREAEKKGMELIHQGIWFNEVFEGRGTNKGGRFNSFDIKREGKQFIYQYEDEFYQNCTFPKAAIANKVGATLAEITDKLPLFEQILI